MLKDKTKTSVLFANRTTIGLTKKTNNGPTTIPLTLIAIAARSYREQYIEAKKRFRQTRQDEPSIQQLFFSKP